MDIVHRDRASFYSGHLPCGRDLLARLYSVCIPGEYGGVQASHSRSTARATGAHTAFHGRNHGQVEPCIHFILTRLVPSFLSSLLGAGALLRLIFSLSRTFRCFDTSPARRPTMDTIESQLADILDIQVKTEDYSVVLVWAPTHPPQPC